MNQYNTTAKEEHNDSPGTFPTVPRIETYSFVIAVAMLSISFCTLVAKLLPFASHVVS